MKEAIEPINYYAALDILRYALVTNALSETNGRVSDAARALKLHRTTLVEIIRRLGINPRDFVKVSEK